MTSIYRPFTNIVLSERKECNMSVFYICVYFLEMLIAYIVFSNSSEKKYSVVFTILLGTLIFESGFLVNIVFKNTILINAVYFFLMNLMFSKVCFQITWKKASFYAALMDVFAITLEFATIFVISTLFHAEISSYQDDLSLLIIEGSISKLLYFFTCLILLRFLSDDKSNARFPVIFYVYLGSIIASVLPFWYICARPDTSHFTKITLAIISLILFAGAIMIFLSYQHSIVRENELFALKNEYQKQQTDKAYYEILEHQNQRFMIYAHDIKKHLEAIKNINESPALDKYLSEMSSDLYSYQIRSRSGNKTLDVILDKYISVCEMKNIQFHYDFRLSNLSFVEDHDLVTILGNLLDNAVEAAEKSKEKFITIETDYRNSYVLIFIENSCDFAPITENGHFITTKEETGFHGIGLKSVSKILKKYSGDIHFEYKAKGSVFLTTVILKH